MYYLYDMASVTKSAADVLMAEIDSFDSAPLVRKRCRFCVFGDFARAVLAENFWGLSPLFVFRQAWPTRI